MLQVNTIPVQNSLLKVSSIPSFVTQDDFGRLFLQLEGCVSAQLMGRQPTGDQIGYVEFDDKMNASKAKNLYQGWGGWGGRGLNVEFSTGGSGSTGAQQAPGQKRTREGEDAFQQAGGNYKQQRADTTGMGGLGGVPGLQQDGNALLQVSAGMLSGLMQPGLAAQLMGQTQQQQGQQQLGGLQSAGIASGIAGGSTPTGQQILQAQQQGQLGLGGGQQSGGQQSGGQQAGQQQGMLGSQQAQGQQGMGGLAGMGGTGQQGYQGGYMTADGMAGLASSLGQMGQYTPQQAQQAQQQAQPLSAQQLAGLQGQLPAGFTLQPGTVLLQPTGSAGYQQLQPGQVIQLPQQQAQQVAPQPALAPSQQPQYLQPGQQPQYLQQGQQPQYQVLDQSQYLGGQPGVVSQQGLSLAQPTAMAPIPIQQAPPGATILQPTAGGTMQVQQYPPDACPTLYAEGFPEDMTKRELAHIFRPFEGYKGIRFVIKDSKKHIGEKLVMAFIEFSNTYYATECMNGLQGYPIDLDDPGSLTMRIKYARPLDNPPRGPPGPGPYGGRGGGPGGRGDMGGRGGGRGGGYYDQYGGGGGRGGYGGRGPGRMPPPRDDRRDDRDMRRDDRDPRDRRRD